MLPWHAPTTPFIGRDDEAAALARAVEDAPLVSVVGPGGIGKTRLVHEVLGTSGALFVDLSGASTAESVVAAVGGPLLGPESSKGAADVAAVGRALAHVRPPLIVLDNVEQAFDALPATLGSWLQNPDATTWVATSRRALALSGEAVLHLGPLRPAASAALFTAAAPSDRQSTLDTTKIASLVALLDGLPLALEIAATRLSVLSMDELTQRLGTHLSVLSDPVGRRPQRHRTLEATLAWSWDLLDPWLRDALTQLSGFVGPFDLPAAEAVAALPAPHSVVDALQALVARSLLHVTSTKVEPRFRMLSTTRAFARSRTAGDARHAMERRMADWAIRTLGDLRAAARSGDPVAERDLQGPLSRHAEECLRQSIARADRARSLALATLVFPAMTARSEARRICSLIDTALDLPPSDDHDVLVEGEAVRCLTLARVGSSDPRGKQLAERLLSYPDEALVAWGHAVLGQLATGDEALRFWKLASESSVPSAQGVALMGRARRASAAGAADEAVGLARTALQRTREHSTTRNLVVRLWDFASVLGKAGRLPEMDGPLEEALALSQATMDHQSRCISALMLSEGALRRREPARALEYLHGVSELCRRIGLLQCIVSEQSQRALALVMLGRLDEAVAVGDPGEQVGHLAWSSNQICIAAWTALVLGMTSVSRAVERIDAAAEVLERAGEVGLDDGTPAEVLIGEARVVVSHLHPPDRPALALARAELTKLGADQRVGQDVGVLRGFATWYASTLPDPTNTTLVSSTGAWFEAAGHPRVDLSSRTTYQRILAELVRASGAVRSRQELVRAGWPGEQILERAAGNRLRVALSHLRKAGFDLIERAEGGWRLSPERSIWVVRDPG